MTKGLQSRLLAFAYRFVGQVTLAYTVCKKWGSLLIIVCFGRQFFVCVSLFFCFASFVVVLFLLFCSCCCCFVGLVWLVLSLLLFCCSMLFWVHCCSLLFPCFGPLLFFLVDTMLLGCCISGDDFLAGMRIQPFSSCVGLEMTFLVVGQTNLCWWAGGGESQDEPLQLVPQTNIPTNKIARLIYRMYVHFLCHFHASFHISCVPSFSLFA